MKPHPRIRKTIKWCGAALCMILVLFASTCLMGPGVHWDNQASQWKPVTTQDKLPTFFVVGLVFALTLAATISAWRADARARRRERDGVNLCKHCGCDRTGIAAGAVCPECGSSPA